MVNILVDKLEVNDLINIFCYTFFKSILYYLYL